MKIAFHVCFFLWYCHRLPTIHPINDDLHNQQTPHRTTCKPPALFGRFVVVMEKRGRLNERFNKLFAVTQRQLEFDVDALLPAATLPDEAEEPEPLDGFFDLLGSSTTQSHIDQDRLDAVVRERKRDLRERIAARASPVRSDNEAP